MPLLNDSMKFRKNDTYYTRLQKAFILSLVISIILFYFSPRIILKSSSRPSNPEMTISVIEIPPTWQKTLPPPKPEKPVIPVAGDEFEFTADVEISQDSFPGSGQANFNGNVPVVLSDLPLQPRQILEVVPENITEDVHGEIVLKLRIGMDGSVKEDKVIANTTRNTYCLQQVLEAARKSRWQPVKIKGQKVEYWIQKSYIFD